MTEPDTTNELDEFLKTLKVHNKELHDCFNDAVAVQNLRALITKEKYKDSLGELEELMDWYMKAKIRPYSGSFADQVRDRIDSIKRRIEE